MSCAPSLQFEALAGYSAVIDRLGEFQEAMDSCKLDGRQEEGSTQIVVEYNGQDIGLERPLMEIKNLTLATPDKKTTLIKNLCLEV